MKFAIAFGAMSLGLAAGAITYPDAAVLFLWAAMSFGCVALGYGGLGVRIFGKSANGRIPWRVKFLLLPYLLYTWVLWHLYRIISREVAYDRIDRGLVIGRRLLAAEIPDGFDHYVDLTAEFEDPPSIRTQKSYRCFPILDASVPGQEELERAVEAVRNGATYIHCAQGHGRTGLFAVALLLRRGRVNTVDEGIDLLKRLRPALHLNRTQTEWIKRYQNRTQFTRGHGMDGANPGL